MKLTRLEKAQKYFRESKQRTLDELLDEIQVQEIDDDTNLSNEFVDLTGWFTVVNQEGIIAYFGTEEEANFYRLAFINRILNH